MRGGVYKAANNNAGIIPIFEIQLYLKYNIKLHINNNMLYCKYRRFYDEDVIRKSVERYQNIWIPFIKVSLINFAIFNFNADYLII